MAPLWITAASLANFQAQKKLYQMFQFLISILLYIYTHTYIEREISIRIQYICSCNL